ncbi:hypothetical protein [Dyella sp. ASV21]|uniref:hypothetical protein n=1 Tax=Dyella sp. ASV21 TaxID=2795114 RepID=UPI0018EDA705|nr:hypothetical protein [Dyella sp. ASV21]
MSKPLMITVLAREPEPARFERDGVVRDYFKQWASVEVDGLVNSFEFSSDEPVQPGPATLDPRSFSITNGRLALGRVKLVPLANKAAPTPASPIK